MSAATLTNEAADEVTNDDTKPAGLLVDETGDSCRLQYIEIVPLTRDTDGLCTTKCVSGDLSAEFKQDFLSVIKQETDDSCRLQYIEIVPVIGDTDAWNTDPVEDCQRYQRY